MKTLIPAAMTLSLLIAAPALAQAPAEGEAANPTADVFDREGRIGLGAQLTWPTYGLSGMLDLGDRIGLQAVLGTAGYGVSITGRGLFRLAPQQLFVPYGYGEVGTWTGYLGYGTLNFGAGGGLEADPRRLLPELEDFPPIYVSLEAGLNVITWSGGATWTRIQAGTAFHYRF